jgi:hypothetical protein
MSRNLAGSVALIILMAYPLPTKAQNIPNDMFMKRSPGEQALLLGAVVQAGGHECDGASVFFMGLGTIGLAKDQAFWSVRCTNDKAHLVTIKPDAAGSMVATECVQLRALTGLECFKLLSEQK